MEKAISAAQAGQLTDELKGLWQLIQFSLGQNQALQVALGSSLGALPDDSPLRLRALSDLESYRRHLQADPKSLGQLDGFDSVRAGLATAMGEALFAPVQTGPSGGH